MSSTRTSSRIGQQRAAAAAAAMANPASAAETPPDNPPRWAPAAATRRQRAPIRAVNPPVANVTFALTPYRATLGVIDYCTPEGRKFFEKATAKLNDDRFDCKADNLRSFLEDIKRRAQD